MELDGLSIGTDLDPKAAMELRVLPILHHSQSYFKAEWVEVQLDGHGGRVRNVRPIVVAKELPHVCDL